MPPAVAITLPTSTSTRSTTPSPLALGRITSHNNGVTQVTWANRADGNGTATATTRWTDSVPTQLGAVSALK